MALRTALLIAAAAMAVVMGALLPATAWPDPHLVGGTSFWALNVNYDLWVSRNNPIPVGEALEFIYDANIHNVVRVPDETSYNDCNANNMVETWQTGDDLVPLPEPGRYFFFCDTHCNDGMKFTITAVAPSE